MLRLESQRRPRRTRTAIIRRELAAWRVSSYFSAKGIRDRVRKGISLTVGAQQVINSDSASRVGRDTVVEVTTEAPAVQLASLISAQL